MNIFKTLLATVACLICLQPCYSQTPGFEWAKKLGSSGSYNQGNAIAIDHLGNVYTTGQFRSTSDFDPGAGTFNLTSAGTEDVYISKLDNNGNFVWAKSIGSTGFDEGWGIAVDPAGNVYISGHYQNTVDFDPGAGISNHTAASGDIFIIKLDTNGNFIWGASIGSVGIGDEYGYGITTDASGNVYTTGVFVSVVDFDPGGGIFNMTAAGNYDVFILKLDTNGNFVWAKQLGGTQADNGKSIALDALGNIYTTGSFRGTTDFDPGASAFNITSASVFYDIFISKLDPSGNFLWAKNIGGTGDDLGQALAIDPLGNVYTTGYYNGTADFDPGPATFNITAGGSQADIFISKLDASGNFSWAKGVGSTGAYPNFGRAIATDAAGNVYATGAFEGVVDFDPGAGVFNISTAGDNDIFILKLNTSGDFIWAGSMGYVDNDDDEGLGIKVDAAGNIYSTGKYRAINASGLTDFDPGSCVFNLSGQAAFIQKLNPSAVAHTITSFTPTSGPVGTSVTITGTDFSTTPANNIVAFNSTAAVVTASTSTSITTTVPVGATSGPISVTIGCNSLTSVTNFTISSVLPTITSFTPSSGPVSTTVTITGTNFSATPANNTVRFNGTLATATASTVTSITTSVPSGASTGPITVTVSGNTAASATNFTVTTGSIVFTTQPSDRSICGSATTSFTVVATGDNNLQYQWQIDDGGGFDDLSNSSTYSGVTTSTLTITNPPGSLDGSLYRCLVSGDNSGDTASQIASLFVNAFPAASISLDGPFLLASDGDNYQWYSGGNIITGATNQSLQLNTLEYGEYTVQVTTNGCSSMSLPFVYLITSLEPDSNQIKIYPNPVGEELRIEMPNTTKAQISIIDVKGHEIKKYDNIGDAMDVRDLPAGVYMIRINTDQKTELRKVIKR